MQLPKRILSIDVLRAITMFLMIFVNDVAGLGKIPEWIKHTAANEDGMGFSDLIFPAFLFIVGLSLPFALQARLKNGAHSFAVLSYMALRALALIVMGFFHVNLETYHAEAAGISKPIFTILLTLCFFLIWLDYPKNLAKTLRYPLIILGIAGLATLAFLYKGGTAQEPKGLSPSWWGILGIIGWAYLFSALTYFLTKGKIVLLIVAFIIFALINVTTHLGLLQVNLLTIGDASSITLMMGGILISSLYSLLIGKGKDQRLWIIMAIAGLCCLLFGFLIRPYAGGISKIYATPAWVFICMGITILTFQLMVYLVDVKEKKDWFHLIKPAGTSILTCYLIPYLLYAMFSLIDFNYPYLFNYGLGGILRSLVFAFIVIRIVAFLEKRHIRLKV